MSLHTRSAKYGKVRQHRAAPLPAWQPAATHACGPGRCACRSDVTRQLKHGTFLVVPPALIKRSVSHFVSLPQAKVDVILGLNGYVWVSRARAHRGPADDDDDDDDETDGPSGEREWEVPFGGGGGEENGQPEDAVRTRSFGRRATGERDGSGHGL